MAIQPSRILILEDEEDIRDLIALHLKREGYEVEEAIDGEDALKKIRSGEFQLYVLDWMVPEISGLELIRILRSEPRTLRIPILMVTARMEATDIVVGLEAGADDYVTKPFEIPVLLARVRALLRRAAQDSAGAGSVPEPEQLTCGELVVNLKSHDVRCGSETIHLTASEFKLLTALLKERGRVMTRQQLIDSVQGAGVAVVDRTVDTHVFGLRKKLDRCSELIETIRGVGYRVRE